MHGPYDVLVGVDGSLESKDALVWAVTEARSRHTRLTVGYVCEAAAYGLWTTTRTIRAGLRELSQPIIDEAVAQARRLDPEISVRGRVVLGSPSRSLLSLSAGSQLIVVGRQGKGALATHLLGSVSQRLMAHALCPVVAVSHPREGGLGIGVALIAGVAVRIATVSGVLMMAFMWLADFPLAQHTSAGTPSGFGQPARRLSLDLCHRPGRPRCDICRNDLGTGSDLGEAALRQRAPLDPVTPDTRAAVSSCAHGRLALP